MNKSYTKIIAFLIVSPVLFLFRLFVWLQARYYRTVFLILGYLWLVFLIKSQISPKIIDLSTICFTIYLGFVAILEIFNFFNNSIQCKLCWLTKKKEQLQKYAQQHALEFYYNQEWEKALRIMVGDQNYYAEYINTIKTKLPEDKFKNVIDTYNKENIEDTNCSKKVCINEKIFLIVPVMLSITFIKILLKLNIKSSIISVLGVKIVCCIIMLGVINIIISIIIKLLVAKQKVE